MPPRAVGMTAQTATVGSAAEACVTTAGRDTEWDSRSQPRFDRVGGVRRPGLDDRFQCWLEAHQASLAIVGVLLFFIGLVNGWNLHGWPGRVNDDEGTYVGQAWAMVAKGQLAHYTYRYDHPFLGWAVIAGYAWLTDGFHRAPSAVMVGREVMLISTVLSCVLLFGVARRLGVNRALAAVSVAMFGLSPLAVYHHRMVFLDNLATLFMLAALVAAASPRGGVAAARWSAMWFAVAALCKETIVIVLPAVVWLLVQHTDRQRRQLAVRGFAVAFAVLVSAYPVFALSRHELLPGPGHVSLASAVWWQLVGRPGSGSLLDPASDTVTLARSWVDLDPWLLLGGTVLAPAGLAVARLRPVAAALQLQVLVMCRPGYVPFAYVTALLPFAALLIGGAGDVLWRWYRSMPTAALRTAWRGAANRRRSLLGGVARGVRRLAAVAPLAAAAVAALVLVVPAWAGTLRDQATVDGSANSRAATRWVIDHVPKDAVVVTDDYIWMDLTLAGFTRPVWMWKVDTDPAVTASVLPHGADSIDYVVTADQPVSTLAALPTLERSVERSDVVTRFGEVIVRRVRHDGAGR
jgi:hypothetical protein